jgi:hypothetical protein
MDQRTDSTSNDTDKRERRYNHCPITSDFHFENVKVSSETVVQYFSVGASVISPGSLTFTIVVVEKAKLQAIIVNFPML